MKLQKFKDPLEATGEIVAILSRYIKQQTRKQQAVSIAISAGVSSTYYLTQLANQDIDWNWVHFFWVHEQLVSPDSQKSHYKLAQEYLFDKIVIPSQNIHRIKGELKSMAVEDYEKELRDFFGGRIRFDFVLLGFSEEGYISSYFPHLFEKFSTKKAAMIEYEGFSKYNKMVSLAFPVINSAKKLFLLAYGGNKTNALEELLNNWERKKIPLNFKKLVVFTDIA